jgi:hypothetical protein
MPVLPTSPDQLERNNAFVGGKGTFKSGIMGFSGCDISATIRVPAYSRVGISGSQEMNQEKVFRIGTLQTISISTYNSKTPVKALGFKNPIAIARGGRTIAGTMIFNQLHKHVLDENDYGWWKVAEDKGGMLSYSSGNPDYYIQNADANDKLKRDMLAISKSGDLDQYTARKNVIDGSQAEIDSFNSVVLGNWKALKDPTPTEKEKYERDQEDIVKRLKAVEALQDAEFIRLSQQYDYYHQMRDILQKSGEDKEYARKEWDFSWDGPQIGDKLKPSDILPFDIIILLFNEAGNMGKIILYGVEIVHDSLTLSVEDIYTEVQYQYIARDIVYFEDIYGSHEKDFNFMNARGRKIQTPAMKVYDTRNPEGSDIPIVSLTGNAQKEATLEATLAEARKAPISSNLNAADKAAAEKIKADKIRKLEEERQKFENKKYEAQAAELKRAAALLNDSAIGGKRVGSDSLEKPLNPRDYDNNAEYQKARNEQAARFKEEAQLEADRILTKSQKEFDDLMEILKANGYPK